MLSMHHSIDADLKWFLECSVFALILLFVFKSTQVHNARSSLWVTHPSTNHSRGALTFGERATEIVLFAN